MKMQEMNYAELQEVIGGSIFGGNDSSSSNGGLLGGLGISNLLSYQSYSQNGDQSKATSFSLGNGITSSLGGLFGQSSKSV
jgi:bacteriocin-like protein